MKNGIKQQILSFQLSILPFLYYQFRSVLKPIVSIVQECIPFAPRESTDLDLKICIEPVTCLYFDDVFFKVFCGLDLTLVIYFQVCLW